MLLPPVGESEVPPTVALPGSGEAAAAAPDEVLEGVGVVPVFCSFVLSLFFPLSVRVRKKERSKANSMVKCLPNT